MAAKKQNEQVEAVETREQKKKKDLCLGCDLDCTACEVNGAKTLRRAACRKLKQESDEISKSLVKKAKQGDASSAKLLLLLTEAQPAKEDAKKAMHGRRMAQELAEEPEWSEEVVETFAAPGSGSLEPEG